MRTDNSTADDIVNKTVKENKAMDKKFYWLQNRVEEGEFKVALFHKVSLASTL